MAHLDHEAQDARIAPLWLVAHDFSEIADAAATEAAAELAARDGTMVLLHVYASNPPAIPLDFPVVQGAAFPSVDLEGMAHADVEEKLLRIKQRLEASYPGLFVETTSRLGAPAEAILDVANELDVDRIVVGTHARHGLARALRGSVAERLARDAKVPVLVVKQAHDEHHRVDGAR
jgi:nucleotide-binding universal stress UspA family protein